MDQVNLAPLPEGLARTDLHQPMGDPEKERYAPPLDHTSL